MDNDITLDTILHAHKFHRNLAVGIAVGAVTGYVLVNGRSKVVEIRQNRKMRKLNDK